jgi:hypothetical protein
MAEFWTAMLGGDVAFTNGTNIVIRPPWVWLCMMQVANCVPPTWPDEDIPEQIHFDLASEDLESAVVDAERLGARRASKQPEPGEGRVMLGPAGHPFCHTHIPLEVP